MSQARAKLNPVAFRRLNDVAVNSFYQGASYYTWEDHRVLAVDGSRLRLPGTKDITKEFGSYETWRNADQEVNMARCSLLYNVLNHVTVDSQIGSYRVSEKELSLKHFDYLKAGDLVLGDRNYPSAEMMYRLTRMGVDFCFWRKKNWWIVVSSFYESEKKEEVVEIKHPSKVVKELNISESERAIRCRLICIELENGGVEILCRSLQGSTKYEYDQFEALYHARWHVEEAYKLLKSRIEIEGFTGRTSRSVYQDFYAKVFRMTFCAALS